MHWQQNTTQPSSSHFILLHFVFYWPYLLFFSNLSAFQTNKQNKNKTKRQLPAFFRSQSWRKMSRSRSRTSPILLLLLVVTLALQAVFAKDNFELAPCLGILKLFHEMLLIAFASFSTLVVRMVILQLTLLSLFQTRPISCQRIKFTNASKSIYFHFVFMRLMKT